MPSGAVPHRSVEPRWTVTLFQSAYEVWDAPNVYVTDGACMTSSGCVNPSLTYMALTARAADHAVRELKAGNL